MRVTGEKDTHTMEKPTTRSKNKLWKTVQAAVTFRNRADAIPHRPKTHHHNKGFSGPMIPAEARRKPKNFEDREPTSPKVSCIGQIKHATSYSKPDKKSDKIGPSGPKKQSGFKKMFFGGGGGGGRKSDASIDRDRPTTARGPTPSLIQMRRFASSRDALAGFDWTAAAQISPAENREYYSDGEDDVVVIPFSAPILETRKETKLWNRRRTHGSV